MSAGHALITGASSGLGAEFARQLAAVGKNLVLVARRQERLAALAAELGEQFGVQVAFLAVDLSDPAAGEEIERFCGEGDLCIDVLINNAGSAGPDLLVERNWQAQRAFYQLMMVSIAELCHRFIPDMVSRGYGRVVNIASVAGRIPRSGGCNYGPSKAYVVALSEELNLTLDGSGVHVTALCPGFTHTDFHEVAGLTDMKAKMSSWLWYNADVVVSDGLVGVEAGKPIVISGRLYRWLDPLLQSVLTRRLFRIKARPQ